MNYVRNNYNVPGISAAMLIPGKGMWSGACGYSTLEPPDSIRPETISCIMSSTKSFMSTIILQLAEEGKLSLDDSIGNYLTNLPATISGQITIRQLLTHTSGLDYPAIGSAEFRAIYAKAGVPSGIGNDQGRLGDRMTVLGGLPLRHHPGERFTYSLGSDVLGALVEAVSGQPFDVFLRTRIFEPLGMRDTWFFLPADRHDRLVTLHDAESGTAAPMRGTVFDGVNPDYPRLVGTYFSGGAGLSSTVEDYARFLQLFLNGGELGGVRLLSRKTVGLMLTDQLPSMADEVGLGFGLETAANDHRSPVSLGTFSWGGAYNTTYWADPEEQLVGLIYTNLYNTAHRNIGERFKALAYQAIVD